jgi:tetratricopeptide (TPR) repeat protein
MGQDLLEKALRHMDIGENQEAGELLRRILEQDPENHKACDKLGVLLARESRFEEAKYYFSRALEIDPNSSSAANNLGNIYFEAGDLEKAEAYYEKALVLDPANPLPYNNLAVVYKRQNKIGDYVKYYKKYLDLTVHSTDDLREHRQKIQQWKGFNSLWWILGFILLIILIKALI